jgi:hypothetical protein
MVNPLLGAAVLFWGSPRIKNRQDRGARKGGVGEIYATNQKMRCVSLHKLTTDNKSSHPEN